MRLMAYQRLRQSADFKVVFSGRQRAKCEAFTLCFKCDKEQDEGQLLPLRRLGVVASKRVGKAVVRNRAKRIYREIFRLHQEVLPFRCDVIIIAHSGFSCFSFQDLTRFYLQLCRRAFFNYKRADL